jgi:hypothetical protein
MTGPVFGQLNRIVGFDGDPAPDGNGIITYFFNLVPNDEGELAFAALLDNTSGDDGWAIYKRDGTTTTHIVRRLEPAPDGNGTFWTFDTFALTNSGLVAFKAPLNGTSGGTSDNSGIFLNDGALVHQIAREGSPVPNGDGTFRSFSDPQVNDSGEVTFQSTLQNTSNGTNNDYAIYIGTSSQLSEIAREGDPIPGRAASFHSFRETYINNAGEIAFLADGTGSFDDGIYFYDGLNIIQIARELADLPDGSGRFNLIYPPVLNDLGQIFFRARLDQTPGGSSDNEAVYLSTGGGELVEVVRKGQPAPDGKGTYRGFFKASIDRLGGIFVQAQVDYNGNIEDVLLLGDVNSLAVIVREGDPSPDGNGTFSSLGNSMANESGQVVFYAVLENTANGFDDNYGIFAWDRDTGVHKITRERDTVQGSTVVNFDVRSVDNVPNRAGINQLGQVAYRFDLANGQYGAAVWTKPFVAESLEVNSGTVLSGSMQELGISDNIDMTIARNPSSTQSVVEFTVHSNIPLNSPTELQFLLEASVFSRGEISQTIEWFDYDANQFEIVDSRPANRFTDLETLVNPTGDISRFVEPSTGHVTARVRFSSSSTRAQFSASIDRIWWNATNW